MGCCHSKKAENEQSSLKNTVIPMRDKRLEITNIEVKHKVSSIVKPSSKNRNSLASYQGAKLFETRQPELPLTTPQIIVEF